VEETAAEQTPPRDLDEVAALVAQTVAGLQRSSGGAVLASAVKRAILRKDPTFSEADVGFRAFGELLRYLAERNVVELTVGSAKGDPEVSLPAQGEETEAFELLRTVVADQQSNGSAPQLSGLKNKLRKVRPGFSEKKYGYGGFLQFCRAAATNGYVTLDWDDDEDDYLLTAAADPSV
jgi:hypothetical protein